MRGEGPEEDPALEEEEGRRWLSRTETLDSHLWDRLMTEEAAPGFWRERWEEDRPSPNRGVNGKERKKRGKEEEEEKRGIEQKGKTHEVVVHHGDGI